MRIIKMTDKDKIEATVQIQDLTIGDRFISGDVLWTLTDLGDDYYTARKHSTESRALGVRGRGYHGDAICSFPKKEKVVFVPVADEQISTEVADLCDEVGSALSVAQNRINILLDSIASSNEHALWWNNGDPKPLAVQTRKDQQTIGRALTKLQENK